MTSMKRIPGYPRALRGVLVGLTVAGVITLGVVGVTAVANDYTARTEVTPWAGPEVNANAPSVAEKVVGMKVEDAGKLIEAYGLRGRIVSVDGVPNIVTADFVNNRINLDIADGVVTGATIG
jgi:hypothetical protein